MIAAARSSYVGRFGSLRYVPRFCSEVGAESVISFMNWPKFGAV